MRLPGHRAGRHVPARRPAARRGPRAPAPTRCIPATASSRSTPSSRARARTPGSPSSGRRSRSIAVDGQQDRGEGAHGRGRRARPRGGRPSPPALRATRSRRWREAHRLPAAREGGVRWRRAGDARRRRAGRAGRRGRVGAREAAAAFGDGTVFLERLVVAPRHIEVQVLADTHGNAVHLFERECSIQRRHQKLIEETPRRGSTRRCGPRSRRRRGHRGAGDRLRRTPAPSSSWSTPNGDFFFLEVNTRLQVEHPVTELDHRTRPGRAAARRSPAGRRSPPEALERHAQRPRDRSPALRRGRPAGFLPTTGRFHRLSFGGVAVGESVTRVDSGYDSGDTVSTFYDALLAEGDRVGAYCATRRSARSPARCDGRPCTARARTATCSCARSSTRSSSPVRSTRGSTNVTIRRSWAAHR